MYGFGSPSSGWSGSPSTFNGLSASCLRVSKMNEVINFLLLLHCGVLKCTCKLYFPIWGGNLGIADAAVERPL